MSDNETVNMTFSELLAAAVCQSPGSIGQSSPGSLSHPVGL